MATMIAGQRPGHADIEQHTFVLWACLASDRGAHLCQAGREWERDKYGNVAWVFMMAAHEVVAKLVRYQNG